MDDADATSCSAAAVIDDESVVVDAVADDTVASSASIISGTMGRDPNPGRVNNEKASPLLPSEEEEGALPMHLMLFVLATLTLLIVGERELPTSTL